MEYRPPDNYEYLSLVKQKTTRSALYDLENDPHENNDLVKQYTDIASRMKEKLHTWEKSRKQITAIPVKEEPLSQEIKQNLKSLGYVQ